MTQTDYLVPSRLLVEELAREEQLEVRRADHVARDLAAFITQLGRLPSADELEEWLEGHRLVSELYASTGTLEELLHRHFERPAAKQASVDEEAAPDREAHEPELEAMLREAPDDLERYLVYSDWLQERGDPLGELIALGVAASDESEDAVARFQRCLRGHEARFLGPLATRLPGEITLRWRYGFVQAIEASWGVSAEIWRQLLDLRVCELLRELKVSLHGSSGEALADTLSAVTARAARTLRRLSLESSYELPLPEVALRRQLGELSLTCRSLILPAAIPATIERLRLHTRELATSGGAPRFEVRELELTLTPSLGARLPRIELPRLERLDLDLRWCSFEEALRALRVIDAPALRHLTLSRRPLEAADLRALARLPLAGRLTALGLNGLELDDGALQTIAAERASFASLSTLDLSDNELTREGLEVARGVAAEVVSQRQERRGTAAQARLRHFAGSRLAAAEEIADPKAWRDAGREGELLWAHYRGNADYELYVTRGLDAYGCSCPSSIRPCKHVVALALVARSVELPERPAGGIQDRVARYEWEP